MLMIALVLAVTLGPVPAYNQGNRLYAQKDYAGATLAYQRALEAGPNPTVQYNLGNALFKSGKIGRAIASYRRARYLAPRDADVAANLVFARTYRTDKLPAGPSPLSRMVDDVFHRLSNTEAVLMAALTFTLAAMFLALWIVRRWSWCASAAALALVLCVFAFATQQVWRSEIGSRPAVVTVPEINALSGPSEDAENILQLHDGTEVRIREVRGDFALAQVAGGGGGWIHKAALERIY